jgi:hypothetical protein
LMSVKSGHFSKSNINVNILMSIVFLYIYINNQIYANCI